LKKTLGGERTADSDRFWIPLKINQAYSDKAAKEGKVVPKKKEDTAEVQISIEILPKGLSALKANGNGRDTPNQFPVLPNPTGRLSLVICPHSLCYRTYFPRGAHLKNW
jgi:hypothetical protein